jgi:histone-lysine N-methyltransferase SETMAR
MIFYSVLYSVAFFLYVGESNENLKSVIKIRNTARLPHTARSTDVTIEDLSFECLPHPPYSPDLAPSYFHVFGPLKGTMGGKSFRSDEEVQQAVHEGLQSQPKDFF